MDNFWSDCVQGTKALDYDRRRRIRDEHRDLYISYLGLRPDSIIADIGCGPGNFSRKISRWLDGSGRIIGIDRDGKFLEYARMMADSENIANIDYVEGDALALPLEAESVDACYSAAVIQYVDPEAFLLEQMRVCRQGGSIAVMNMVPGAKYYADECLQEKCEREQELWDMILKPGDETLQEWDLLKNEIKPSQYPQVFAKVGLADIQVNAISLFYAADDARNSLAKKLEIIEADRQNDLEVVEIAFNHIRDNRPEHVRSELIELINRRYALRIDLLQQGEQLWDFRISTLLIVKGTKK